MRRLLLTICFTFLLFLFGCGRESGSPDNSPVYSVTPGTTDTTDTIDTSTNIEQDDPAEDNPIGEDPVYEDPVQGDPLEIIRASLPLCKTGMPYEQNAALHTPASIQVLDAGASYTFELLSGNLPDGLTMDAAGIISGITFDPSVFSFTIKLTDQINPSNTYTQALQITVMQPGTGTQPYEIIQNNPRNYYVHQDAGTCGPTCFYMILKYLGDISPDAGPSNADLSENIPNDVLKVVSSAAKIYSYLMDFTDIYTAGMDWLNLEDAAYAMRSSCLPFYPCIQSNAEYTAYDEEGIAQRTAIFKNDLVTFLQTNTPVLVHLKRPYYQSGHYITVIGYKSGTDEVLYLDPYNEQFDPRDPDFNPDMADWPQVIQSVSREAFITEYWFEEYGYTNARWDGRWLGFKH